MDQFEPDTTPADEIAAGVLYNDAVDEVTAAMVRGADPEFTENYMDEISVAAMKMLHDFNDPTSIIAKWAANDRAHSVLIDFRHAVEVLAKASAEATVNAAHDYEWEEICDRYGRMK